jgi:hypothetical protein
VQNELGSDISTGLADPTKTPQYASGVNNINQTYKGAADTLTQQLAARGFGSSGVEGSGLENIALSRAGAIGSLTDSLQSQFEGMAQQFGFANPTKTTSGSNVGAGSQVAGALGGGGASLTQSLNQAAAYGAGGGS